MALCLLRKVAVYSKKEEDIMKRNLLPVIVGALMLPAAAFAQSGIRNSKHDLSNSSTSALKNQNPAENQICKYCHTPHRAQSTQVVWNHTQTANVTHNWGNDLDGNGLTQTTQGTALPTTLRSRSRRCLGCHDGSVAIGDVSNAGGGAPGIIPGLESIAGFTDATGKLIDTTHVVGASGNMGGNHPVSIAYAGQSGYNGTNSGATADGVDGAGNYWLVATTGCTSASGICTNAPTTDGRNGANIQLIPNTPGTTTNVGIECVSCHEPHKKYGYPYFARVDVTSASGLCRSCHAK